MSSYQYYEFQAIDRLLTEDEQHEVAALSSRVKPHPRQATFIYHWSDFPADPRAILLQYYDAFFYESSWGSRQLMFRFPQSAVDLESALPYCQPLIVEDYFSFSTAGAYTLLNVEFHEEGGSPWLEEPGSVSAMISLRDDLVRGDYRALYLAWLKVLEVDDLLPSVREPPVPPGLQSLTPALHIFADFLGIDEALIQVAAQASGEPQAPPADWLRAAVDQLPSDERDTFLLRLAQGEPHLTAVLNRRLREIAPRPSEASLLRRTVDDLLQAAEAQREQERKRRAAEAEARRISQMEALAQREAEVWAEVETLIERMQAKPYDQAVELLVKLHDLAHYQDQEAGFQQRIDDLYERYPRRSGLLRRLREAGLVQQGIR